MRVPKIVGIPVYPPNGNFKRNNDDKAADFRVIFGYLHLPPRHICDESLTSLVTVKQRIQLKLPYDSGSPWGVDMRKLGCERLAHFLGKEVALWLTRDKKRNPSPKIVQKHPLFDDIPVSIFSGRAGSSKVNIIAAKIAMLKNGREREINHDQPLDLGFPGSFLTCKVKLVYNPINSICILPMNHRDKRSTP